MLRVLTALIAAVSVGAPAAKAAPPTLGGCPVFPATNPWNRDVSRAPVHPRSDAYVRSINAGAKFLHADFGGDGAYGIPVKLVPRNQRRVPIRITDYPDESDPGPYPVPLNAPVERGSDRHVLTLQRGTCRLYELFGARRSGVGWAAAQGSVFDLRSNRLRPAGHTSADAAGLPILPGLARYDEMRRGAIRHALRFTVQRSQRAYIHPARHFASSSRDPDLPPMGLRLRLKRSYSLARFRGQSLVILRALKRYGMFAADNGSSWYVTGAADRRWDDEDLNQLKTVPGSAFEAVYTGRIRRG
ncbi:MAG: hypothetical protein M3141_08795 [Actinomycetota bacterium]|nr:hypothetical protein [Actinomycetota bacterium]